MLGNQYTFLAISCIFTKVTAQRCVNPYDRILEENVIYKQNALRSIGHIFYPIFVWFVQYKPYYNWFTISMVFMVIAAMSSQITNLINLVKPGKNLCQNLFLKQKFLLKFSCSVVPFGHAHNSSRANYFAHIWCMWSCPQRSYKTCP